MSGACGLRRNLQISWLLKALEARVRLESVSLGQQKGACPELVPDRPLCVALRRRRLLPALAIWKSRRPAWIFAKAGLRLFR